MQIDRTIYHAHPATGEYLGEGEARLDPLDDTFLLIPAHATQDKPPEAGARQAAVWSGSEWTLMADYRGVVYSTESGAALQHDAIGELPEGLTHLEWPGVDFAWSAEAWVLDETARAERLVELERAWRNAEVERVKWLRERHRDERELEQPTTLSTPQFGELMAYIQQLRDWPQSEHFPDVDHRPRPPEWINDQTP